MCIFSLEITIRNLKQSDIAKKPVNRLKRDSKT